MKALFEYRMKRLFERDSKEPNMKRMDDIAASLGLDTKPKSSPIPAWISAGAAFAAAAIALMLLLYAPNETTNNNQSTEQFYKVTFNTPSDAYEDDGELFAIVDDTDIEQFLLNLNENELDTLIQKIHPHTAKQ